MSIHHFRGNSRTQQMPSNHWQKLNPPANAGAKGNVKSLNEIFVTYELNLTTDDFNSITITGGESLALRQANELIGKHLCTNSQMHGEILQNCKDYQNGFISNLERMEKNHEVYLRYGISGWDDDFRSWSSSEEKVSVGVIDLETLLRHLPHNRLLDFALNLSEHMFLPPKEGRE